MTQTIVWTDLTGADFKGTKFIYAKLDNTIFKNAILDNTNFKSATVTGTDFSGASCKNIRWIDGTLWADGAVPGGPCSTNSGNPPPPPPPPTPTPPPPRAACPIKKDDTCNDIFSGHLSSIENVKAEWKKLSRICHVDKTGDEAISKYINCCYQILKEAFDDDQTNDEGTCKW